MHCEAEPKSEESERIPMQGRTLGRVISFYELILT